MHLRPQVMAYFLLFGVITCSAQTSHENEQICDQQRAKKVDIADADATILGFAIGASLKDVQAKLGSAKVERVSGDEESDVAICYVSPTDGTVLVFYSGAMGGWKNVTWFALWSRNAAFPHASRCTPSAEVSQKLSTQSGLRLGLTEAQVKGIAGTATSPARSSVKYDYVCRRKMTDEEIRRFQTVNDWDLTSDPYFDRMSWVGVHFANAMVSRIEIGRIESY
jgi:hypothetical protein